MTAPTPAGVSALLAALPTGLRRGADTRGILVSVVTDVDPATGRVLAPVGPEATWLLALTGTYTPGDLVAILRNPWTGKGELVLGVLPAGALDAPPPIAPEAPAATNTVRRDGPVRITTTHLTPGGS